MMEDFWEILQYTFFQNAIWVVLLISLLSGMIGTYIVSRKIVFIGGGITHASFGGIGMAYYFGINPLLGAAVFGVFSALGIEWISQKGKIREDSAIAVLWSLGMALGIIFVFMTPGYTPNLMSFLFGSILSVSSTELFYFMIFTVLVTLFFLLFFRPLINSAFDPEFASIMGVKSGFFRYTMSVLIAISIVMSIRAVGIILVLSLFTIPQITAMLFTRNFLKVIPLSVLFSVIGSLSGLFVAHMLDIPSGAAIVFFLTFLFLVAKIIVFFQEVLYRKEK
ncbi:MAG: metal ABC transporter permease [Bacteroidota bacterium]